MVIFFFILTTWLIYHQFRLAKRENIIFYKIFVFLFALRLLSSLIDNIQGLPLVDAGNDEIGFLAEALRIYNQYDLMEILSFWSIQSGHGNFPKMIALIYKAFGPYPFIGYIINFILFGYIQIFFSKIILLLFDLKRLTYVRVLVLFSIYPVFYSYGLVLIREIIIIWIITLTFYNYLYYLRYRITYNKIYSLVFLNFFSLILHTGTIVFPVFIMLLFVTSSENVFKGLKYTLISAFVIVSIVLISLSINYYGGYFEQVFKSDQSVEAALDRASMERHGSIAKYNKYYTNNMLNNLILALPIDISNFLFSPFPLPLSNLRKYGLFRYPAGIVYIIPFVLSIIYFRKLNRIQKTLLLIILLSILPYVLGSGDVFQAVRHKTKFYPIVAALFVSFFVKTKEP